MAPPLLPRLRSHPWDSSPIPASAQPAHPLLPALELWSPRNPRRGERKAWERPGHLPTPGPPSGASFLSDPLLGLERWMSRRWAVPAGNPAPTGCSCTRWTPWGLCVPGTAAALDVEGRGSDPLPAGGRPRALACTAPAVWRPNKADVLGHLPGLSHLQMSPTGEPHTGTNVLTDGRRLLRASCLCPSPGERDWDVPSISTCRQPALGPLGERSSRCADSLLPIP